MISLKKLQQLEKKYLKPSIDDNIYEYVKLTENIDTLEEYIQLIKDLYDDTINMYIECSYFNSILKKFNIKLNMILLIKNVDDLKKYLKLKKHKLLNSLYNSPTGKLSYICEKKCIEFNRIKGGKKFNVHQEWFQSLLKEIGQI